MQQDVLRVLHPLFRLDYFMQHFAMSDINILEYSLENADLANSVICPGLCFLHGQSKVMPAVTPDLPYKSSFTVLRGEPVKDSFVQHEFPNRAMTSWLHHWAQSLRHDPLATFGAHHRYHRLTNDPIIQQVAMQLLGLNKRWYQPTENQVDPAAS